MPFSVTFRITVFSMGAHLGTRKSVYVVLLPPFFFFSILRFTLTTIEERIGLSRWQNNFRVFNFYAHRLERVYACFFPFFGEKEIVIVSKFV